jgi:hypothetical protein
MGRKIQVAQRLGKLRKGPEESPSTTCPRKASWTKQHLIGGLKKARD